MAVRETVELAFQSIGANTLRAVLTMLGIIIGVAAVVTMVALGTGAQRAIDERIKSLGAQLLSVYAGQSYRHGVASSERVSLTTDDAAALARDATLATPSADQARSLSRYPQRNERLASSGRLKSCTIT